MVATDDRRAQLILVGAVSLALIIIGLTVVLNTVLFTSTVTTDVTVDASDDAVRFDQTAREGTRSLVLRMNHRDKNFSRPQLRDSVVRNVTNYTRLLRESYTVSRPVFVNVSYNNVTYGQRVVQSEDGTFESPTTPSVSDWEVVENSDRVAVGRFVVNLNVSGMNSDEFNITIRNASESVDIGIQRNNTGGATKVDISTERTHGPNTGNVQCFAVRGRVLLDVLDGESFNSECAFNATENLDPPYSVEISDGGRANGRYSLVARSNVSANFGGSYDFCGDPAVTGFTDPCQVPAIWSTNVTMAYSSTEIDYERRHNLSIYP
ncbi:hypothetical protein [Halorientalis litorea]|jgi:hypothetical protein|uniref:hypothetical protein n=1 Tax=Halorientalis litorea TaxID=2931977 RepID=UPI001FF45A05|nr:hypothetical protein [Halorientalis litorea]